MLFRSVVNMALGYALIFGKWGFPRMGLSGAGLASSLSEFLALIFLFLYAAFKSDIRNFHLFRFLRVELEMISKIVRLSLPLVVQNLLSMGAWFIFFIFIEKIGEHALAISNVVRGAYMIAMTPIWGFSVAANSMVSNIIGQDKSEAVMQLLHRILKMALAVTALLAILVLLFPKQILRIFSSDEILIADSLGAFYIVIAAMMFFSFAIVCISAVSGTGATRAALLIEIGAIVIYLLYNYKIGRAHV